MRVGFVHVPMIVGRCDVVRYLAEVMFASERDWTVWVGVAGSVVTAVAVVLAVLLYRLAQRDPIVRASCESAPVVDPGSASDIRLMFRGEDVPRVSRARITFWNAGRGAVDGERIVEPLGVAFPDGTRVLAVSVEEGRSGQQVRVEVVGSAVKVTPRYLNHRDQFSIEVTHDGSGWRHPALTGTIVGAPSVRYSHRSDLSLRLMVAAALFFWLGVVALGVDARPGWLIMLGLVFLMPASLASVYLSRRWMRAGRRPSAQLAPASSFAVGRPE